MSSLAGFTDGRLFAKLDERVNLKRVYKQAEFVARMLTVSTFMDDALRMVLEFYSQKVTMEILGFSEAMSAPLLLISILVQTAGAFSVIAYVRPGAGWCAHTTRARAAARDRRRAALTSARPPRRARARE